MTTVKPTALCVDDEPEVLEGLKLHLRKSFNVTTASGGEEALKIIAEDDTFSVVLSDMRMPQMNGAAFLARCRECIPNATRMLLTGYSEIDAAIEAVNSGQVFRFLTKPCPPEQLLAAFQAAVEQHRLVTAEQELLENTLNGSIKMITEVLSLAAPAAFSRANIVKRYVQHMASNVGLRNTWVYELSGMLAQIGCITLPPETLGKAFAGQDLTNREQQMVDAHPTNGHQLLSKIPRLEVVADIVRLQRDAPPEWPENPEHNDEGTVAVGAAMLKVATAIDVHVARGDSVPNALAALGASGETYSPKLLDLMKSFVGRDARGETIKTLNVMDLRPDMVLDEDILTTLGAVVCRKGVDLTRPLIGRIRNFAAGVGIDEPVRVTVPVV